MDLKQLLFSISKSSCITGAGSASETVLRAAKEYAPGAFRDTLGNVIAPVRAPISGGPHLLLEAHMDEIGFIVTEIDDGGFLRVDKVGGTDLRVLLGQEVTVFCKEPLFGVFCCRPPHICEDDDYKKVPKPDELAVDIGFSHDEACKKVYPGDYLTLRQTPADLLNGVVTGKALDNRAGVAAVLRCLEICSKDVRCGLTAAFTLSEELGCRGAVTAAFSAAPTHAIAVDTSYGFTPDSPREKCGDIGSGPMIGISPVLSREMTSMLFSLAKERSVPFQTEVMGGETGTNADAVSISRGGVPTALLSVPLCYMHTGIESVSIQDIESTARLMSAAAERIGGGMK